MFIVINKATGILVSAHTDQKHAVETCASCERRGRGRFAVAKLELVYDPHPGEQVEPVAMPAPRKTKPTPAAPVAAAAPAKPAKADPA